MRSQLFVQGPLLGRPGRPLALHQGVFTAHFFQNLSSRAVAIALTLGDVGGSQPLLARVHSSCMTSETFGACDCDCSQQMEAALTAIAEQGRGVLFYLMQEGRGAGLTVKARDRMLVQNCQRGLNTFEAFQRMGLPPDARRYPEVAWMTRALKITAALEILTNNPRKVAALRDEGVAIHGTRTLFCGSSPFNAHYLTAQRREGHWLGALRPPDEAELPEPVDCVSPKALTDAPTLVHTASYWLPIQNGGKSSPHWFRIHLYFDLEERDEHALLAYGNLRELEPLVRLQPESVIERFPLQRTGFKSFWRLTVDRFVAHGSGLAVFLPDRGSGFNARKKWRLGSAPFLLLRHHLGDSAFRPLWDGSRLDDAFRRGAERHGLKMGSPLLLAAGTAARRPSQALGSGNGSAPPPSSRQLEGLTWPDFEALLAQGRRTAVIPLGSTEQHGPHLPFATDTWIAEELARRFCQRVPEAVALPALPIGCASEHLDFPGTLHIEPDTLRRILLDLLKALSRHRLERVFIFSAHGGNAQALDSMLPDLKSAAPELKVAAHSQVGRVIRRLHSRSESLGVSAASAGHHAGELETSIVAKLRPGSVRQERLQAGFVQPNGNVGQIFYPSLRRTAPNGVVGDPRMASPERADAYLEAWTDELVEAYRRQPGGQGVGGKRRG